MGGLGGRELIELVGNSIKVIRLNGGTIIFGPLSEMKKLFPNDKIIYLASNPPWTPSFPLKDMSVQPFNNFKLAFKVSAKLLEATGRALLACVGGRGRSGAVASALLAYLGRLDLIDRLYHEYGSPETREQYEVAIAVGTIARRHGLGSLEGLEYDGALIWRGRPVSGLEDAL